MRLRAYIIYEAIDHIRSCVLHTDIDIDIDILITLQ